MEATIDGVRVFYESVGGKANYPLILLHGGPGLDHTYLQPWYDVLADAYRRFMDPTTGTLRQMVYAPEMLVYFAANEYPIEYEDRLGRITRPTLIITGAYDRTCTPRASQDLHAGIPDSELAIIPDAGHMTFAEQPDLYFAAIRNFFPRHPVAGTQQ